MMESGVLSRKLWEGLLQSGFVAKFGDKVIRDR
jgi:hypothetical protein